MTVSTSTNSVTYVATGATNTFDYDFVVYDESHFIITLDGVEVTSGFTITGLGDEAGGTVVFDSNPTGALAILRRVPFTQDIDYSPYDPFPAETHERGLDLGVMRDQQLKTEVDQAQADADALKIQVDGLVDEVTGQADRAEAAADAAETALENLGPTRADWTFTTGGVFQYPNEAAFNSADGNYYSYIGPDSFPFTVAPGTNPVSNVLYQPRTDVVLREQLSTPGGECLVSQIASIDELLTIAAVGGNRVTAQSYHAGWAATSTPPRGGGTFIFVHGSQLDDKVVNFKSSVSNGSWRRASEDVSADDAGMHPDFDYTTNDVYFSRLISYCKNNSVGFVLRGMYQVSTQIETSGIPHITGESYLTSGLWYKNKSSGDRCVVWGRYTKLESLRLRGDNDTTGPTNGVVGLSRGEYRNVARGVQIDHFGIGNLVHDSVDMEFDGLWVSHCHIGVMLDGFESGTEFSTTLCYKNAYIIENVVGMTVGNNGPTVAVDSLNLHNCIFERNTFGFVCDSNGTYLGTTFTTKPIRNITFSGYTWWEGNQYAYILKSATSIVIASSFQVYFSPAQLTVDPSAVATMVNLTGGGLVAGSYGRRAIFGAAGVDTYRDGSVSTNGTICAITAKDESGVLGGAVAVLQDADYATNGRITSVHFYTKSPGESGAVSRWNINNGGHLKPSSDNIYTIGNASLRPSQIYAANASISTSDEREKAFCDSEFSDAVLDAWGLVNWRAFKWIESVQQKGESKARIHFGLGAQSVKEVFESAGLDPFAYGLLCYDEWDGERPGSRYGIRYDECFAIEAAYQRRRCDRIEARLTAAGL